MTKPVIKPKEKRLFIDERMKMKKPEERTIVANNLAALNNNRIYFN